MTDELVQTTTTEIATQDLLVLQRIRDLWANRIEDDEIRDVLNLSWIEWTRLMTVMKTNALPDNFVEFQKYLARTNQRAKNLERVRNTAEATEELGTAVKCLQLEADMDKSLLEMGQKLGVLKPEVIKLEGQMQTDVRLQALFAHLDQEKQQQATTELADIVQDVLAEGIALYDTKSGSSSERKD